jgi:hypothetical protein
MGKIRLGEKVVREGKRPYPREVDYFVLKAEDGITEEVIRLYGPKPKELRMMLPFEYDARDPQTDDEIVWNVWNRAYGSNAGLRCKGSGQNDELPGAAETSDEKWAVRIAEATRVPAKQLPNGRWQVQCRGTACPKYSLTTEKGEKAPGHDPDAACRRLFILRAFLLHPTRFHDRRRADGTPNPDYLRTLGIVEIASGSINTMTDVQSGFEMLRPWTRSRTAAIPFSLVRKPTFTYFGGKKLHWPLQVTFDSAEAAWAGARDAQMVYLNMEEAEELRAIHGAVDFDTVRDLVPTNQRGRPLTLEAAVKAEQAVDAGSADPEPEAPVADREEVAGEVPTLSEEELDRPLIAAEREELKALAGERSDPDDPSSPWTPATLARVRELALAAHAKLGTDPGPEGRRALSNLLVRHAIWVKSRLAGEPEEEPEEEPSTDGGQPVDSVQPEVDDAS